MSDYISKEIELEPYAETEADGFITPPHALEQKGRDSARPMTGCAYPKCETCDRYHGSYCTVPMVVTKQLWLLTEAVIADLRKEIAEIREMVYDTALSPQSAREQGNYFAEDVADDEVLPIYEWDDEYGHQRFPLTNALAIAYEEYEQQDVIHNLTVVGHIKRSDIP